VIPRRLQPGMILGCRDGCEAEGLPVLLAQPDNERLGELEEPAALAPIGSRHPGPPGGWLQNGSGRCQIEVGGKAPVKSVASALRKELERR